MAKNWWEMGTAELQNDPEALRASYGFSPSGGDTTVKGGWQQPTEPIGDPTATIGGGWQQPTEPIQSDGKTVKGGWQQPDQPSYGPAYGPGTDPFTGDPSGGGGPGLPGPRGGVPSYSKPPNQPNPLDVAMTPEMDYPGHIAPAFGGSPDPIDRIAPGMPGSYGGIKGLWGGTGKGGGGDMTIGPGPVSGIGTGWWDWTKEGIPDKGGILPVGQFPEGPAGDPYRENAPPGWGQPQPGLENRPEGETGGKWLDAASMPRGGQRPVPPTTGSGAAIPFPVVGGGRDFVPGPPDPNWMRRAESGDNYPGFGGGALGPVGRFPSVGTGPADMGPGGGGFPAVGGGRDFIPGPPNPNPFGRGYQPMGGPGTGGTPALPRAGILGPYGGIGALLRPQAPAATKNWWEMSPEELRSNPAALRASYGYGG